MVAAFYRGGEASKDDPSLTCTSSTNRARRRAISPDVGVALLGPGVSGYASFVGVEGSGER